MTIQTSLWAGVCGLVAASGVASADVAVITATLDNSLYESATGTLSNGQGPSIYAGKTNADQMRRGLVKFDLAGSVPAGATVTSVVLTLHVNRTIALDVDVSIFRALKPWGEGTSNAGIRGGVGAPATTGDATWLHTFYPDQFWSGPGGVSGQDYAAGASATIPVGLAGASYTWGSTPEMVADVQSWVDAPGSNNGWFVIGDESTFGTAKSFDSRESPDIPSCPILSVTFTPPAPPCYANCDGSTVTPVLNANDFQCFLNKYASDDPYANCDGSTVAPVLNANDFQCFLNAFAVGC